MQAYQWDPRDPARAGKRAGKSICQREWLRRQHNKFYQILKSRRQKFLFSEDSKETCA